MPAPPATCIVREGFIRWLSESDELEEDLLDKAWGLEPNSRLSCQAHVGTGGSGGGDSRSTPSTRSTRATDCGAAHEPETDVLDIAIQLADSKPDVDRARSTSSTCTAG